MAVRLRLQRGGAKKRPFYRVVATDKRNPRDGRFIEMLGTYDPTHNPPIIRLNSERVEYWMGTGASPSDTVAALVKKVAAGEGVDLAKEGAEKLELKSRRAAKKAKLEELRAATVKAHAEAAAAAAAAAAVVAAAPAEAEVTEAPAEAEATEEAAAEDNA